MFPSLASSPTTFQMPMTFTSERAGIGAARPQFTFQEAKPLRNYRMTMPTSAGGPPPMQSRGYHAGISSSDGSPANFRAQNQQTQSFVQQQVKKELLRVKPEKPLFIPKSIGGKKQSGRLVDTVTPQYIDPRTDTKQDMATLVGSMRKPQNFIQVGKAFSQSAQVPEGKTNENVVKKQNTVPLFSDRVQNTGETEWSREENASMHLNAKASTQTKKESVPTMPTASNNPIASPIVARIQQSVPTASPRIISAVSGLLERSTTQHLVQSDNITNVQNRVPKSQDHHMVTNTKMSPMLREALLKKSAANQSAIHGGVSQGNYTAPLPEQASVLLQSQNQQALPRALNSNAPVASLAATSHQARQMHTLLDTNHLANTNPISGFVPMQPAVSSTGYHGEYQQTNMQDPSMSLYSSIGHVPTMASVSTTTPRQEYDTFAPNAPMAPMINYHPSQPIAMTMNPSEPTVLDPRMVPHHQSAMVGGYVPMQETVQSHSVPSVYTQQQMNNQASILHATGYTPSQDIAVTKYGGDVFYQDVTHAQRALANTGYTPAQPIAVTKQSLQDGYAQDLTTQAPPMQTGYTPHQEAIVTQDTQDAYTQAAQSYTSQQANVGYVPVQETMLTKSVNDGHAQTIQPNLMVPVTGYQPALPLEYIGEARPHYEATHGAQQLVPFTGYAPAQQVEYLRQVRPDLFIDFVSNPAAPNPGFVPNQLTTVNKEDSVENPIQQITQQGFVRPGIELSGPVEITHAETDTLAPTLARSKHVQGPKSASASSDPSAIDHLPTIEAVTSAKTTIPLTPVGGAPSMITESGRQDSNQEMHSKVVVRGKITKHHQTTLPTHCGEVAPAMDKGKLNRANGSAAKTSLRPPNSKSVAMSRPIQTESAVDEQIAFS